MHASGTEVLGRYNVSGTRGAILGRSNDSVTHHQLELALGEVCAYTCRQTGVQHRPGITHAGNSFFGPRGSFARWSVPVGCIAISVPDV